MKSAMCTNFRSWWLVALTISCSQIVPARGVSPYLPLNLSPRIERSIERVMILAGEPVIRRPIPAAVLLDALPRACALDRQLCDEVQSFLQRYMRHAGLTQLSAEVTLHDGESSEPLANSHGRDSDSAWQVTGSAFYLPNDHLLLNAGALAYEGRATPTGSYLSTGFDFAQVDIGYRDRWFSPLTDSSTLLSTEAPTMPSISVSNYRPLTRLGISYEVFLAQMSRQTDIRNGQQFTSGHPKLAGLQAGVQPVPGYAFAVNRMVQYGGGDRRGGGLSGFIDALFDPSLNNGANTLEEFGNQQASITSTMAFPGRVPFAARFEYAGEDNSYAGNYRLGATAMSLGIDFPRLGPNADFSYEASEWQTPWYVHHLYPQGMTNRGYVLGHWFGDQQRFGDAPWGRSQMLRFGWRTARGNYWQFRYRTLSHEPLSTVSYVPLRQYELQYSTQWRARALQLTASTARDVFGDSVTRAGVLVDLVPTGRRPLPDSSPTSERSREPDTDIFIDVGANYSQLQFIRGVDLADLTSSREAALHVAVGARRRISDHSDLGVRIEHDRVADRTLWSARLVDYRYRFGRHVALSAFGGVGRYADGLPAYGYYGGAGLQYLGPGRNWELGLDYRVHNKLGRDKVLPGDPPSTPDRTRLFYDVSGLTLYLSRHL